MTYHMKAQGTYLVAVSLVIFALAFAAITGVAGEPPSSTATASSPVPALTAAYTNGSLTLAWPKSAVNWLLSTQAVNGKIWTFVPASQYGTNATDIYLTITTPAEKTLYRLVKVSPAARNWLGHAARLPPPPLPPMPTKPGTRARPANSLPPQQP